MKSILNASKEKSPTSLSPTSQKTRELVCELCRNFYQLGWASGTGGGISIKEGGHIYMAPSGVQKERLQPGDAVPADFIDLGEAAEFAPEVMEGECAT